ncbi:hypothetical protein [Numidum massiliense]|uniref:hypothetical protein n=1 Tax=Numidum massiliense TaxID=1522315 RepID=UPI0006D57887|nr:hypothetical protein [Numidum massiliense]
MLLNPRFQRNVAFVLVFACFAFVFGEYTVLASGSSETESQLEISDEMLIVTIQQFMTEEEIQAIESEFKESLGDPQVQGVLGGTLKVLRYVGWAFRTGGKALSKILGYLARKMLNYSEYIQEK